MDPVVDLAVRPAHYGLRGFQKACRLCRVEETVNDLILMLITLVVGAATRNFFPVRVRGRERVPRRGPVILAANHASYLDPVIVGAASPRWVTFVSKQENFEVPILGPLIEMARAYPIVRGSDSALPTFRQALEDGECVAIYPEGTIPAEEEKLRSDVEPETGLLRGKTGVVRLALLTGAPVVPMGISGAGRAVPPEVVPHGRPGHLPAKTPIRVVFGEPIPFERREDLGTVDYEELRARTDDLMQRISELVDFGMDYIPREVPVTEETYERLRAYEEEEGQPYPFPEIPSLG